MCHRLGATSCVGPRIAPGLVQGRPLRGAQRQRPGRAKARQCQTWGSVTLRCLAVGAPARNQQLAGGGAVQCFETLHTKRTRGSSCPGDVAHAPCCRCHVPTAFALRASRRTALVAKCCLPLECACWFSQRGEGLSTSRPRHIFRLARAVLQLIFHAGACVVCARGGTHPVTTCLRVLLVRPGLRSNVLLACCPFSA